MFNDKYMSKEETEFTAETMAELAAVAEKRAKEAEAAGYATAREGIGTLLATFCSGARRLRASAEAV